MTLAANNVSAAAAKAITRHLESLLHFCENKITDFAKTTERLSSGEMTPGSLLNWKVEDIAFAELAIEVKRIILTGREKGISDPETYQYLLQRLLMIVFTGATFNSTSLGSNAHNIYSIEGARRMLNFLGLDSYAAPGLIAEYLVADADNRLL